MKITVEGEECPDCHGDGFIPAPIINDYGIDCIKKWCDTCKGLGIIDGD